MDAAIIPFYLNAGQLVLIVNGHGLRTVVSVMPRGLYGIAVTPGARPAWASYDVDAATMHMERHERGIHIERDRSAALDVRNWSERRGG